MGISKVWVPVKLLEWLRSQLSCMFRVLHKSINDEDSAANITRGRRRNECNCLARSHAQSFACMWRCKVFAHEKAISARCAWLICRKIQRVLLNSITVHCSSPTGCTDWLAREYLGGFEGTVTQASKNVAIVLNWVTDTICQLMHGKSYHCNYMKWLLLFLALNLLTFTQLDLSMDLHHPADCAEVCVRLCYVFCLQQHMQIKYMFIQVKHALNYMCTCCTWFVYRQINSCFCLACPQVVNTFGKIVGPTFSRPSDSRFELHLVSSIACVNKFEICRYVSWQVSVSSWTMPLMQPVQNQQVI